MKKTETGRFSDLYLFAYNAKTTMALYFMAFVLFYLFLGIISMETDVVLDFTKAIQMLFASMVIGFGQELIVPVEQFNATRCAFWMALASAATICSVVLFRWFDGFPVWCGIVFCTAAVVGFAALLLGLLFDSRRETKKLNEHLKVYQNNLP